MPTVTDGSVRHAPGSPDWSEIQPLISEMLGSLQSIAQLRDMTLLAQLIGMARDEAQKTKPLS
jgi:hypothetical protein